MRSLPHHIKTDRRLRTAGKPSADTQFVTHVGRSKQRRRSKVSIHGTTSGTGPAGSEREGCALTRLDRLRSVPWKRSSCVNQRGSCWNFTCSASEVGTRWPSVPARPPPCEEQRKSPLHVLVWASRSAVPGSNCSGPAVVRIRGGFIWRLWAAERTHLFLCATLAVRSNLYSWHPARLGKDLLILVILVKCALRPVLDQSPHPKKRLF